MTNENRPEELSAIHRLDIRLTSLEVATDQREGASVARHEALMNLLNQRHDALILRLTERDTQRAAEITRIWAILGALGLLVAGAIVKFLSGGHP